MIKLGAFDLLEPLGAGGMGEVWRGRHAARDVPTAIKLIKGAATPKMRANFEREVQAHAGLSHPGVVYLFDYGIVTDEQAAASVGRLTTDSPYLVLELADGTLRNEMPCRDWHSVRTLVASILDGLAHAHARGVIHRDLKPENILIFRDGELARPKLADFGIAHALGAEHRANQEELTSFSGTPYYVAPEQALGRWREYGPWTDLYALGCVVWELVTGHPPFCGDHATRIIIQHVTSERPKFVPRIEVPAALSGWLARMLARAPGARFRNAAQALHALPPANGGAAPSDIQMQERGRLARIASGRSARAPGSEGDETVANSFQMGTTLAFQRSSLPPALDLGGASDTLAAPPFPARWQREQRDELPDPLVGAGLGLFGLRETPFVNRDESRDRIWRALGEVIESDQTRVVLLLGGPGTGKSSLAEWAVTRASEVGAATALLASHTANGSGGQLEGLAGMWRRTFRTFGLPRHELYDHLSDRLRQDDEDAELWGRRAGALTEWLRPRADSGTDSEGPTHTFSSAAERYVLAERVLHRLASRGPLILWLDDLQWSGETLAALEHLVRDVGNGPGALIIATLRADVLSDDAGLAERVEAISRSPNCQTIELAALDAQHHRELISRMLHLEPELLESVAARTEGNPLFATHLLRHLIEREQLEVGQEGFRLADGAASEVPQDIVSLWTDRIDRLAGEYPHGERAHVRHAVELAATLGRQVALQDWQRVCDLAQVRLPQDLIGKLCGRGLAAASEDGFQFAHGMLVDSLHEQARLGDRWSEWNRCCAQMLEDREGERLGAGSLRCAEHWLAAGDQERAVQPLLRGAEWARMTGELRSCSKILRQCEAALDSLGVPPCEPRRVKLWCEQAQVHQWLGERETAVVLFDQAKQCLDTMHDPHLRGVVLLAQSEFLQLNGQLRAAMAPAREAYDLFRQIDDPRQLSCLRALATQFGYLGEREEAIACYERACAFATEHGVSAARSRLGLSYLLLESGRAADALHQLELARREFEATNNLVSLGDVESALGEAARGNGRLADAERHYRRAGEIARETGRAYDEVTAEVNLGMVALEFEDPELATRRFAWALERAHRIAYRFCELVSSCGLLAAAALQADWERYDRELARITCELSDVEQLDTDIARLLTDAGLRAAESGQPRRARPVLQLAHEQWTNLGVDEPRARVELAMRILPPQDPSR